MSQPALVIFAKQPIPGLVKTRLLPRYTAEQAAEIAEVLLRATVELAASTWPGVIYLYAWPSPDHALFRALSQQFGLQLMPQAEGDLGEKMLGALREAIGRHGCAAVIGCDVPHCPWDVLDQANDWLAQGRNVIGPTEDGGYYFLGLQQPWPDLFTDIPWSTPGVLDQTLKRAEACGIELELLLRLRDVDTPEDLWLVAQTFTPLQSFG